jgi:hypothetical protein
VFSNGRPGALESDKPQVTRLGEAIGDEWRRTVNYSPACGIKAVYLEEDRFLVVGSAGIAMINIGERTEILDSGQHMGLLKLSEHKFLLSSGGTDLSELDAATREIRPIAKLRLQGLVSELASSTQGGGYLFAHFSKLNGQTCGVVLRWIY